VGREDGGLVRGGFVETAGRENIGLFSRHEKSLKGVDALLRHRRFVRKVLRYGVCGY
jgi:hypothetical protein